MKLTILGCGSSAGVPIIGCDCATCRSPNPKNKRSRASVLYESDGRMRVLVDASPDLRMQALSANITTVDALVITHAHADHCHGLDDVRSFNYYKGGAIDLYGDMHTMAEVQQRFAYAFREHHHQYGWYKPEFDVHIVDADGGEIPEADIRFFPQTHGRMTTLGLRMGKYGELAYSTDVNHFSDEALTALEGVKVWVVDCLRPNPAPTHAHLELTLEWIARVKPQRAILTHMAHELEYETLSAVLPKGVEVAYDGMVIDL
jgi:phosphoribosyl 1,2-cyclic phosphate phosphodiesterase